MLSPLSLILRIFVRRVGRWADRSRVVVGESGVAVGAGLDVIVAANL